MVAFSSSVYGAAVQEILALRGDGLRPMELAPAGPYLKEAREKLAGASARLFFGNSASPDGAMSGLWLYFGYLDEAHTIAQSLETPDGSFWHGMMHRQEPDAFNSGYWFRRVGHHAVFPALAEAARELGYPSATTWDPHAFIEYCEAARTRPGSAEETLAKQVQLAEWQLLFDHCARPLTKEGTR